MSVWSYPEAEIVTWMSVQDSVQEQEKEHSQGERSEDHIPLHQRSWEDLPANEYSRRYTWVSKFVGKLVRHEHSREREAGCNSFEIHLSKVHHPISKKWERQLR